MYKLRVNTRDGRCFVIDAAYSTLSDADHAFDMWTQRLREAEHSDGFNRPVVTMWVDGGNRAAIRINDVASVELFDTTKAAVTSEKTLNQLLNTFAVNNGSECPDPLCS